MFLLRVVKEIKAEDAARIRHYKTLEKMFETLNDGKFLCKDLEVTESEQQEKAGRPQKDLIFKNVGFFKYPRNEFGEYFSALTYKRSPNYRTIKNLDFRCGRMLSSRAVSLEILDRKKDRKDFGIGQFIYMKAGVDYYSSGGNIHEIARYFHDKRPLYKKIRELLVDNRQEFEETLNAAFVEDLIALFSVEGLEKNVSNFNIPMENVAKSLLNRRIVRKNLLFLGNAYYYPKDCPEAEYPPSTTIDLEFFLNVRNQIIINATCGWQREGEDKKFAVEEIKDNRYFEKFLQATITGFLEQLGSMASFGEEIYEKVKTKIFLENI
jgi:hypothetical protein